MSRLPAASSPGAAPAPSRTAVPTALAPRFGAGWWFLAFALGSVLLAHHPVVFSGFADIQGDEGDVRFNHYLLEHGWRWVTQQPLHTSFFDPPMFFPAKNAAAYSDLMLGAGPLYWPFRALGVRPDTAYQLWCLTASLVNFVAALLLLRRGFRLSPFAASAGSALFVAGASRINQINHPQLLPHFYPLLAVWALFECLRAPQRTRAAGWIGMFCLCTVAQLYTAYYWGWFFGFFVGLACIVALCTPSLRPHFSALVRRHLWAWLGWGAVSGLLLLPAGLHYLRAAHEVGVREYTDGVSPRLQAFFHLGSSSLLYGWTSSWSWFTRELPFEYEHRLGLGLVTLGATGWALWKERQRPAIWLLMVVTCASVLLVMRYRWGFSPWAYVFHLVPGANAIRAAGRMGVWLLLPAAVGLGLFFDRLVQQGRATVATVVIFLCLAEQVNRGDWRYAKGVATSDVERIASHVPQNCRIFFYSPISDMGPSWKYQNDAMWASLLLDRPTVNGYSGNTPPGWMALDDNRMSKAEDSDRLEQALAQWRTQHGLLETDVCQVRFTPAR